MSETLYRKYRPQAWSAVLAQGHVTASLERQVAEGNPGHAYLFSGARGVGKTTVARLFAKSLNCEKRKKGSAEPCGECRQCVAFDAGASLDVVELDAASNTGVDNVRDNVIQSSRLAPASGKYKIFIIDEVHMLSAAAFNALLKTLEEPSSQAIFILATTDVHKVPVTVQSRCQRLQFKLFSKADLRQKLEAILSSEKKKLSEEAMDVICFLAQGSSRDAETLLQQALAAPDPMDALPASAYPNLVRFTEAAAAGRRDEAWAVVIAMRDGALLTYEALTTAIAYWSGIASGSETNPSVADPRAVGPWLELAFRAERYAQHSPAEAVLLWLFGVILGGELVKDNVQLKTNNVERVTDNVRLKTDNEKLKTDNAPVAIESAKRATDNIDKNDEHIPVILANAGIQVSVSPTLMDPRVREDDKERKGDETAPFCADKDLKSKWPEFFQRCVEEMASLSLALSLSHLVPREQGVALLTDQALQHQRMTRVDIQGLLQKHAAAIFGRNLVAIELTSELPVSVKPVEVSRVESFDDAAIALGLAE